MPLFNKRSALCLSLFICAGITYFILGRAEVQPEFKEVALSFFEEEEHVTAVVAESNEESSTTFDGNIEAVLTSSPQAVSKTTSKLRRGVNNRLLLPEAVVTERSADLSAVSEHAIFTVKGDSISGHLTVDEHTLSAIEATMDVAAMKTFLESNDGAIQIPLSLDKTVLASINRVISRGAHTTTIIGQVLDDSFSDILLVFHDGSVNGSISFHNTNTHYQFAMAGNGDVAIRHLDVDSFTDGCGNCENPEHLAAEISTLANERAVEEESEGEILNAPAGAIPFDSVIGYSAEARISDGGAANIEGRIIVSVDNLNLALSNSQSGGYFCSLLAMIEEPDQTFSDSNFSTMGEILGHLNTANDGVLDTLLDLRDELGADQATFVCNAGIAGVGGVANRPGRQSICGRNQMFSPNLVFAHEVGHNLGLRHAWGDSGSAANNPKNQSNYGWRFDPPNGGKNRTIMAYGAGWGGSRIKYFSNPNVSYNGAPTGAPRGFDATDTSGSPAYDQKFVLDGDVGGLGAGFDGSNSQLGARNGDYLIFNSSVLVNKDAREALVVLEPIVGANFLPGNQTTIYWHGGDHTDTVQIDLYKGGIFQSTIASGLTGEERWYDWTIPNIPGGANFTVRVTLSGSTSVDSGTFTIGTPVVSVPYAEGFENGLGAWIQVVDDDFDWTLNTGGTPTGNTGPESASSGSWYLYIEPNDVQDGHNKTAQIECVVDLSTVSSAELSFDYHMYGTNLDYLAVDVYDGITWVTDVWKLAGEQQSSGSDPWLNAEIDISTYAGNAAVTIRIRAKEKYWHVSDIAIDNIIIDGAQLLPFSESFEGGLIGLLQSEDDDLDWTWNSGTTPDNNTGPRGASDGSHYMFVENHDDTSVQYKTASLERTFDFSVIAKPELTFDYHMYGQYIDYLAVDIHDGSGWIPDVWIRNNAQHSSSSDPWSKAVVDLSAYAGNASVGIRFRSKQKQWHAADTAIDNVQINDVVGPLVAHWPMDDNSGTTAVDATGHGYDATLSSEIWAAGTNGSALDFDGSSSTVTLPAPAFATINDEITISMWVYGAEGQPLQDSTFFAENAGGDRVLNVHLPWSDGKVYWDAGFDANFDRISKLATASEYEGQWNHWVFTKKATTGEMAVYLNGDLWHSGTGMTRSMVGITTVRLGSQVSLRHYLGKIDDVRLYNESLNATEVTDLFSSYATTSGVPLGWLMSYGIDPSDAGAAANADMDSLNNELEWLLGTDPTTFGSPYTNMLVSQTEMSVGYTRRRNTGYRVFAQWSPDLLLGTWDIVGLTEGVDPGAGEIETVTATVPIAEGDDKKFIRIKVNQL